MSEQTPDPDQSGNQPFGNPPPPPAANPYATPPPTAAPPPPMPPPPMPTYAAPPPSPGYPAPAYGGYAASPTPQPGPGGLAIGALVVAIAAGVLFWIPFLGLLLALVGLVLGIVSWAGASKHGRTKGVAIAATIVAILAFLGALAVTVFVLFFWGTIRDCADPNLTKSQQDQCIQDHIDNRLGLNTQ